jgi:hypothetical protein
VELGKKAWRELLMFRKLGKCNISGCEEFVYIFDNNCFCFVEPDLLLIIKPSSGLVALICTYVQQDREGGWYKSRRTKHHICIPLQVCTLQCLLIPMTANYNTTLDG